MSQGNYSITTRSNGTILTATIYNADHQNHVTNQNPQGTGAYSDTVAQMQLNNSPGGLGTESLATSLGGELERLRFIIKQLHGGPQWYVVGGALQSALGTSPLQFVSTTQIQLNLGVIPLKIGTSWAVRPITSAVTISNNGLAASTTYFVYAFDNAGATSLEINTTAHITDSTIGVEVKSGDATRTLVGMVRTDAGVLFQNNASQRFVISWFNRKRIGGNAFYTADRATANTTYLELNTEIRTNFICWGDSAVLTGIEAMASTTAGGGGAFSLALDSTTASIAGCTGFSGAAASSYTTQLFQETVLSEGFHFITLIAHAAGGATITVFSNDAAGTGDANMQAKTVLGMMG